jgi:hypothetical protein
MNTDFIKADEVLDQQSCYKLLKKKIAIALWDVALPP